MQRLEKHSPSHAEKQVPAGGHRCLHKFPLGRDCLAVAAGAAQALSPGGWHHSGLSRTGSAVDMGVAVSSGAG